MHPIDRMFNGIFEPFRADKGTPYASRQDDIDFHKKNSFPSHNRGPFLTESDGTEDIMDHNDLSKRARTSEKAAIDRLATAVRHFHGINGEGYRWGPDLAIKAFSDLDLVFFGGCLTGNVCVTWSSNETDPRLGEPPCRGKSQGVALGITERRHGVGERGQCRIILNAEAIFSRTSRTDPFESMMGTLLHEMVHAYDYVRCPSAQELAGDGHRHDAHFSTRLSVIHDRAGNLLRLRVIEEGEDYRQLIFFTKDLKLQVKERKRHRPRREGRR